MQELKLKDDDVLSLLKDVGAAKRKVASPPPPPPPPPPLLLLCSHICTADACHPRCRRHP